MEKLVVKGKTKLIGTVEIILRSLTTTDVSRSIQFLLAEARETSYNKQDLPGCQPSRDPPLLPTKGSR
jgi:hypothetical protein